MTERATIAPTVDIPLSAAVEEITGFEALGIEKRFGRKLEDLGGTSLLIGTVWVFENRREKVAWSVVERMTLRELNGYFVPEPDDVDPSEPDSDEGKGSQSADRPTET